MFKIRGDGVVGNSYNTARLFEAVERLTDIVHRTPCKQSQTLNDWTDSKVYLKLENLQKTGHLKFVVHLIKFHNLPKKNVHAG